MNKKRILLLEDDITLRHLLIAYLESHGYQVSGTEDAQEALALLSLQSFDLIVTDRALKSSCGEEFAAQVGMRHPGIPVLLITGSIKDVDAALFAGVMRKPFLRVDFLQFVRDALEASVAHSKKAA